MGATHYDICVEIRQELIDYVDLTGVNSIEDIKDENLKIWQAPLLNVGKEKWKSSIETPGIIISPSRTVRVPQGYGTNATSDIQYPVLLQICDSEISVDEPDRIHTWAKWAQNIRQHFHEGNLRNQISGVEYVEVLQEDVIDERLFGFHHQMVQYVAIQAWSREAHNTSGSG